MAKFEDAIQGVMNGFRARRRCWAKVPEYTRATPPIAYERYWRIWQERDAGGIVGSIVQGWGGQIGFTLPPDDPIRDGTYYKASNDDRIADDWELIDPAVSVR